VSSQDLVETRASTPQSVAEDAREQRAERRASKRVRPTHEDDDDATFREALAASRIESREQSLGNSEPSLPSIGPSHALADDAEHKSALYGDKSTSMESDNQHRLQPTAPTPTPLQSSVAWPLAKLAKTTRAKAISLGEVSDAEFWQKFSFHNSHMFAHLVTPPAFGVLDQHGRLVTILAVGIDEGIAQLEAEVGAYMEQARQLAEHQYYQEDATEALGSSVYSTAGINGAYQDADVAYKRAVKAWVDTLLGGSATMPRAVLTTMETNTLSEARDGYVTVYNLKFRSPPSDAVRHKARQWADYVYQQADWAEKLAYPERSEGASRQVYETLGIAAVFDQAVESRRRTSHLRAGQRAGEKTSERLGAA
jgi:hypothetical protein